MTIDENDLYERRRRHMCLLHGENRGTLLRTFLVLHERAGASFEKGSWLLQLLASPFSFFFLVCRKGPAIISSVCGSPLFGRGGTCGFLAHLAARASCYFATLFYFILLCGRDRILIKSLISYAASSSLIGVQCGDLALSEGGYGMVWADNRRRIWEPMQLANW